MQGNSNRRLKLKNQLEDQKKAYRERQDEKISQIEYETDVKEKKTSKRLIDQKIPSHNLSWLQTNHPDLEQPYVDYVGKQASTLNKATNFLSMKYGIKLEKEHPISVSGAGDVERSPTNPLSDRGPNDQGFAGNARFNGRLQADNAFNRSDLDQLGVASNWQYSVANFAADRPDIRDPALRAEMNLKPLGPKVSNLGMVKLQQGDLNIDTLQMKMFIEQDLKNSGIELDVNQKADLGAFLLDLENKEQVVSANKHSWKRRGSDKFTSDGQVVWKRGDLVLDKNNQPVREDNWNLDTKKKYSPDNERFEQRDREFFAAEQRKNPIETTLPSQTATTPKAMFKELGKVGGKKLFREVVRKMGGSNNVIANISGDIIGTVMDGVTYAQTKDKQALTDLCLSGGQAMASLGALGIACLPIPGARPGAFALMKVGDNLASVERIYNLMGGTSTVDRLLNKHKRHKHNKNLLETPTTRTKIKV